MITYSKEADNLIWSQPEWRTSKIFPKLYGLLHNMPILGLGLYFNE